MNRSFEFFAWLLRSLFYDPVLQNPSLLRIGGTVAGFWFMCIFSWMVAHGQGAELGAALTGVAGLVVPGMTLVFQRMFPHAAAPAPAEDCQ